MQLKVNWHIVKLCKPPLGKIPKRFDTVNMACPFRANSLSPWVHENAWSILHLSNHCNHASHYYKWHFQWILYPVLPFVRSSAYNPALSQCIPCHLAQTPRTQVVLMYRDRVWVCRDNHDAVSHQNSFHQLPLYLTACLSGQSEAVYYLPEYAILAINRVTIFTQ